MSKATFKIAGGDSFKDGVAFFPSGESLIGIKATRNEDGTISTCKYKFGSAVGIKATTKQKIVLAIIVVLLLFWRRLVLWINLPMFLYYLPVFFWAILLWGAVLSFKIMEPINAQYHGAEHKVFWWFKKNGKDADYKTIQRYSRINPYCGSNLIGTFLMFQIIAALSMAIFHFHISEFFTVVLTLILFKYIPFNLMGLLMQKFTTSEPSDDQIEVALTALNEIRKREELKEQEDLNTTDDVQAT